MPPSAFARSLCRSGSALRPAGFARGSLDRNFHSQAATCTQADQPNEVYGPSAPARYGSSSTQNGFENTPDSHRDNKSYPVREIRDFLVLSPQWPEPDRSDM